MNVGVVDIGTNSMRLLITSPESEIGRWVEVTGLGVGVDRIRRLDPNAMERTLEVFADFGELMTDNDVVRRRAIATSASRDAENREEFFDRAQVALGIRPVLISGEEEGRYAFNGAVGVEFGTCDPTVSDIGGGSTEFVDRSRTFSVDIGSVRLTEQVLPDRPASNDQVRTARSVVADLFQDVDLEPDLVIGVAGTWTSLAAMAQDLERYEPRRVHGYVIRLRRLEAMIESLAGLTMTQTEAIPSLDPKRAPVILAGAIVAETVLNHLGLDEAKVSERDTLDGVASELLALL